VSPMPNDSCISSAGTTKTTQAGYLRRVLCQNLAGACWTLANILWFAKPYTAGAVPDMRSVVVCLLNPFVFSVSGWLGGARRSRALGVIYPILVLTSWHVAPVAWMAAEWGGKIFPKFFLWHYGSEPTLGMGYVAVCALGYTLFRLIAARRRVARLRT